MFLPSQRELPSDHWIMQKNVGTKKYSHKDFVKQICLPKLDFLSYRRYPCVGNVSQMTYGPERKSCHLLKMQESNKWFLTKWQGKIIPIYFEVPSLHCGCLGCLGSEGPQSVQWANGSWWMPLLCYLVRLSPEWLMDLAYRGFAIPDWHPQESL